MTNETDELNVVCDKEMALELDFESVMKAYKDVNYLCLLYQHSFIEGSLSQVQALITRENELKLLAVNKEREYLAIKIHRIQLERIRAQAEIQRLERKSSSLVFQGAWVRLCVAEAMEKSSGVQSVETQRPKSESFNLQVKCAMAESNRKNSGVRGANRQLQIRNAQADAEVKVIAEPESEAEELSWARVRELGRQAKIVSAQIKETRAKEETCSALVRVLLLRLQSVDARMEKQ
eukprot:CAMPEP_0116156980 /NCGR_PEP_ID=MMETSP0329-20121206/23108_1 /TAXON_ID=697910 /ORGANISM="Pseudo-nitzschia arenysensis, Strain B593" /LENGTH=234 /DNA_ID=CAMNT_0003654073 /DNA_START=80 /DNA_END=784 /DNA_ORIENTATION=+